MLHRHTALRRIWSGLAVAVVTAAALGLVGPVAAAAPAIQPPGDLAPLTPGVLMLSPAEDGTATACTAGFVFSGAGATYLGYAAHCATPGASMGLSGCAEPTLPIGNPVLIERNDGTRSTGRLAYSSWVTMQERGETEPSLCFFNDFALVEVDPADRDAVDPSIPVLGGPTALDTDGTVPGEPVYSYQPNNDGPAVKEGVSLGTGEDGLTHRVDTDPSGMPGDSGSGYVDGDGAAFGILSTQFLDGRNTNGVTDLASALSYANRFGDVEQVALVPGRAQFTPPDGAEGFRLARGAP
ncbi:S1 family peptidase [Pseudonocardia nigra]|uniref:S1 family peptidase n=1 Tax=Pseudonocardia nigra TaxID=1921578 RepID=UPI001C5CCC0B|nr:S1 family peptidase [Pseudonocardia nigra]